MNHHEHVKLQAKLRKARRYLFLLRIMIIVALVGIMSASWIMLFYRSPEGFRLTPLIWMNMLMFFVNEGCVQVLGVVQACVENEWTTNGPPVGE